MYGPRAGVDSGSPTTKSGIPFGVGSSGVLQDVASRYLGGSGDMPMSFSSYSQTGYTAVKSSTGTGSSPWDAPRPETPPLAFVDRASFPGYRDPDEAEERVYEMQRVRLEPANVFEAGTWSLKSSSAPKDDYEDDLAAFMRKYGCDMGDSTPAANPVSAPPLPPPPPPPGAKVEEPPLAQDRDLNMPDLDGDMDMSDMSRKSITARPSLVAGLAVERPDCGTARASIVQGAYIADAQSAVNTAMPATSPEQDDSDLPTFRNSILDADFDVSELSRASMVESANARYSLMADELNRNSNPVAALAAGERPARQSVMFDSIDEDNIPVLSGFAQNVAIPSPPEEKSPSSSSSKKAKRGLKAPSNTVADLSAAPEEDDIPMLDNDVIGTGSIGTQDEFGKVLDTDVEFQAVANALEMDMETPQRVSIVEAVVNASSTVGTERVSIVDQAISLDHPEGREPAGDSVSLGRKAPANTIVLANDDAENLVAALSGKEFQEKLSSAAEEVGQHPPANTVAGSPKDLADETELDEVVQALKAEGTSGSRPGTDPGLVKELTRRLSVEADAHLAVTGALQLGDQSRELQLGDDVVAATKPAAGGNLVQKKADKTWARGSAAMPKMQWDLTKEYENDKQIEPLGKYSRNDLETIAQGAKEKLEKGGQWMSTYSESGAQKRDFFQDLNRQRSRDKGAQAMGPIWVHLATQAKNIANEFDLQELLITLKMFTSVRYDDYELYMRLLGEIPRYVATATAVQLCMMVCIMARRRLRERNYVDMVASYLLQKLKVTDDHLPPRMLIKAANAFAALECRSNQRFVEHFLRHIEHRIQELDAELCCKVSPLVVINYMNDSLRRAYLKRSAEVQAGFHGSLEECRNLACTEVCLRKEHHSLVASLPAYVGRYLEKLKQHAAFDRWGTVHILTHHAPNGPKGTFGHDTNRALQQKASTVEGGKKVDVHSSDMHKDVSACLTHLGIEHESGVLCGPYLLDCVAIDMVNPSKRIVYEVNAPHHFYEGTNQLIAEKRVRHRMLGRLGQKLHMINAEEWMKLTSAQKMTFILQQQQSQQDKNEATIKPPKIAREGNRPQVGTVPRVPAPPPRMQALRSHPNRQMAETQ